MFPLPSLSSQEVYSVLLTTNNRPYVQPRPFYSGPYNRVNHIVLIRNRENMAANVNTVGYERRLAVVNQILHSYSLKVPDIPQ
jgi:hypothetical protein